MVLQATKKIFRVIQEVSELGGMGLPFRVAGRQTLMNTSPSRYMNPIPCGVKVNDQEDATGAAEPAGPAHI